MIKVITYGTFDLLHQGHINILKRARALGDYLIVGVTTENFDITRGKINVSQSLMERMEAVRRTGLADEVIPEEYEGQKIDDIIRNNVSVFAVGSDWEGHFDYLNEYCKVIYLPRTEGISSSQLRASNAIKLGVVGGDPTVYKLIEQAKKVNGLEISGLYSDEADIVLKADKAYKTYDALLAENDAVYVAVRPENRFEYISRALNSGKHVIS